MIESCLHRRTSGAQKRREKMPIRGDITIDWAVSPRIIEVVAPSTELTVQDLYDAFVNWRKR